MIGDSKGMCSWNVAKIVTRVDQIFGGNNVKVFFIEKGMVKVTVRINVFPKKYIKI